MLRATAIGVAMILAAMPATAQNRIDAQRPDAPALAAYGPLAVGVRTIEIVDEGRPDILAIDPEAAKPDPLPTYDRALSVEVWYPAAPGATGETGFPALISDGKTTVTLHGRAMRDAAPGAGRWPLVIVSHGYPGNRYLLSHLTENLASKGYVVASIDHRDSTYDDKAAFGSTLYNRPFDQIFTLDEIERLGNDPSSFLNGIVDASHTGLIGYSMGGYGGVIAAGGGVTQTSVDYAWGAPHGTLAVHLSGSQSHARMPDPRLKTVIAFSPWGWNRTFWDAKTMTGVALPILYIAGSDDDVAGYDPGVRSMWQASTGVDRALLTFENANHNAGAPYPAPAEAWAVDPDSGYTAFDHYADAAWDTVRMNNVVQHFATAWLDKHLKGDAGAAAYLDLVPNAGDGVWALNEDGTPKPEHTYWTGFRNRSAKGLRFETLNAGE